MTDREVDFWKLRYRTQHDSVHRLEAQLRELKSALQEIAEQDPVELALDPQWSQRQARFALEVTLGD